MTRPTKRLNSVIAQMPFLRTDNPEADLRRGAQLIGIVGDATLTACRYREAVLNHRDLSERLRALFQLKRPDVWNGYVPPRIDHDNTYNDSPYRAALVEIVTEALKRDGEFTDEDRERLTPVPESRIRAPWKDNRPSYVIEGDRSAAILGEAE